MHDGWLRQMMTQMNGSDRQRIHMDCLKNYCSHIDKILSQWPFWRSNRVINNLLKSTCWCCKALLGCLKTGGEPRPRWAKLWICKTIKLVNKSQLHDLFCNYFKNIWWNQFFFSLNVTWSNQIFYRSPNCNCNVKFHCWS